MSDFAVFCKFFDQNLEKNDFLLVKISFRNVFWKIFFWHFFEKKCFFQKQKKFSRFLVYVRRWVGRFIRCAFSAYFQKKIRYFIQNLDTEPPQPAPPPPPNLPGNSKNSRPKSSGLDFLLDSDLDKVILWLLFGKKLRKIQKKKAFGLFWPEFWMML